MTTPVDEGTRVVKHVIDSGAFDDIRKNVFEELRQSPALREYVREQVESSKTLSADPSKASKDRKKVLDDLQNELKDRLVERASRVAWEILTNSDGRVAQVVEHKVHQAVCRIHEEREKQQQQQHQQQPSAPQPGDKAAAPNPGPASSAALDGGQSGAALPPRPGILPTASLAPQPHQPQLQPQQNRPPPRHYGVYGHH